MEKVCKYCGDVFIAKRSTAEYCSNSHRVMAFRGGSGIKSDVRLTEVATKLFKYMAEKSATKDGLWELMRSFIPPVLEFDTRPIDPKILDVSKEREFTSEIKLVFQKSSREIVGGIVAPREVTSNEEIEEMMKVAMKTPKINISSITEKAYDGSGVDKNLIDEMPMWKPTPKAAKVETKAETERFASAEMKRLAEMQERAAKLKGGKKK
jgi:hypothetical protein